MPVLRINNYIDAYRVRAASEDLHELAARPNKKAVTEFVNRRILEALDVAAEDVLVDLGCGDASLLRMAAAFTARSIGVVATVEEKLRLESSFPDLCFIASRAHELALESASASKIVCNTTLLYLPSESEVRAALQEMSRVARPGATIWVGEIPEIDEYELYGIYRGKSMAAYLWQFCWHVLCWTRENDLAGKNKWAAAEDLFSSPRIGWGRPSCELAIQVQLHFHRPSCD